MCLSFLYRVRFCFLTCVKHVTLPAKKQTNETIVLCTLQKNRKNLQKNSKKRMCPKTCFHVHTDALRMFCESLPEKARAIPRQELPLKGMELIFHYRV